MLIIVGGALVVASVVWVLPSLSDLISGIKWILGARVEPPPEGDLGQRLLVLVPAHNEEGQIGSCVRSIVDAAASFTGIRVVVVSDNSSDHTAAEAQRIGVEVWERIDPDYPGKPRAIQWALDQVELSEYEAVVIIDADTVVAHRYFHELLVSGSLRERVAQTYYGLQDEGRSWLSLLAGLLVRSKYEGQYSLRSSVGLNAPLTGNGMVIGSAVLQRCGWAHDALTENWEMYVRYTVAGERIDLCTSARLYALEPDNVADSSVRRRRWQAGKWGVVRDYSESIFRSRIIGAHQKADLLSELLSPGPVAHAGVGFVGGLTLVLVGSGLPGGGVAGWLLLLSPISTVFWTLRAISGHPDRARVLGAMLRLPFYLLWRLTILGRAVPTYISGVWQRSPRPGDR